MQLKFNGRLKLKHEEVAMQACYLEIWKQALKESVRRYKCHCLGG
jgi:hypothetical protein